MSDGWEDGSFWEFWKASGSEFRVGIVVTVLGFVVLVLFLFWVLVLLFGIFE